MLYVTSTNKLTEPIYKKFLKEGELEIKYHAHAYTRNRSRFKAHTCG